MTHWKDGRLYAVANIHIDGIVEMLILISGGQGQRAFERMQDMVREARYGSGCIQQSLMQAALRGPYHYGNSFSSAEWQEMIGELGECINYRELAGVIKRYSELAQSKLGGF